MRIGDLFKCELGRGILEVIEIIDDENFILHGSEGQYPHHIRDIGKTIYRYSNSNRKEDIQFKFHYDANEQARYVKILHRKDSREDIDAEINALKRIQNTLNFAASKCEKEISLLPSMYQTGARTKDDFNILYDQKNSKVHLRNELEEIIAIEENPFICKLETKSDKYDVEKFYIGKRDHNYHNQRVYSWQSHIGSMFYRKSLKEFRINNINYNLISRRDYNISHCIIKDVSFSSYGNEVKTQGSDESSKDVFEGVYDDFLLDIIKNQRVNESVKEIISTIQEKQYNIISEPHTSNMLIQGCAGSGKTMIMLHRLSYLLYNKYCDKRDILILTPNDNLSDFIGPIIHELDLDGIRVNTLYGNMEEAYQKLTEEVVKFKHTNEIDNDHQIKLINKFNVYIVSKISEYIDKNVDLTLRNKLRQYDSLEGLEDLSLKNKQKAYKELCIRVLRTEEIFYSEICRKINDKIKASKEESNKLNLELKTLNTNIEACVNIINENKAKIIEISNETNGLFRRLIKMILPNDENQINDLNNVNADFEAKIASYQLDLQGKNYELVKIQALIERTESVLARIKNREYVENEFDYLMKFVEEFLKIEVNKNDYLLTKEERLYLNNKVEKLSREFNPDKAIDFFLSELKISTDNIHLLNKLKLIYWIKYAGIKLNYKLVMIDEAQDYSMLDFEIIRMLCANNPVFNLFGDSNQTLFNNNLNWSQIRDIKSYNKFNLNENYRNSYEITTYYKKRLQINDIPIGIHDEEVMFSSDLYSIISSFSKTSGKKALILNDKVNIKHVLLNIKRIGLEIPQNLSVHSPSSVKGMEYHSVLVLEEGMNPIEKYIAYTRARTNLFIFSGKIDD